MGTNQQRLYGSALTVVVWLLLPRNEHAQRLQQISPPTKEPDTTTSIPVSPAKADFQLEPNQFVTFVTGEETLRKLQKSAEQMLVLLPTFQESATEVDILPEEEHPTPRVRRSKEITDIVKAPSIHRIKRSPLDLCSRHHMHKVYTNGGRSWRCRR